LGAKQKLLVFGHALGARSEAIGLEMRGKVVKKSFDAPEENTIPSQGQDRGRGLGCCQGDARDS
jgi:hypothetical protein